jgi:hypothetical protein
MFLISTGTWLQEAGVALPCWHLPSFEGFPMHLGPNRHQIVTSEDSQLGRSLSTGHLGLQLPPGAPFIRVVLWLIWFAA